MGEYDDLYYDPPSPRKQAALEAEIKALRAERDAWKTKCEKLWENGDEAASERIRTMNLRAERDALREAIAKILEGISLAREIAYNTLAPREDG